MRTTNNFPVSNTPHNTPSEPSKPSGLWAKINTVFDKHGVDAAVSFAKTVKSTGVLFLSMAKVLTGQPTESKSVLKKEPAPKSEKELRDLQALEETRVAYIRELEEKLATAVVMLRNTQQMSTAQADLPEDLQKALIEAKSANSDLQDELAQKIDAYISLQNELETKTKLFENNITLAKNKTLEIRQEALHDKEEVGALSKEVDKLKSENTSLSTQVRKLKTDNRVLQEELDDVPEALADRNRETMASIKANIEEFKINPSAEGMHELLKTLNRLLDH